MNEILNSKNPLTWGRFRRRYFSKTLFPGESGCTLRQFSPGNRFESSRALVCSSFERSAAGRAPASFYILPSCVRIYKLLARRCIIGKDFASKRMWRNVVQLPVRWPLAGWHPQHCCAEDPITTPTAAFFSIVRNFLVKSCCRWRSCAV